VQVFLGAADEFQNIRNREGIVYKQVAPLEQKVIAKDKRKQLLTFIGFVLLLVSTCAFAQTGRLTGQVTDPQRAAVPGAEVRISGAMRPPGGS